MKKQIILGAAIFSLGAVAATGFPTFWQYVESLSGSFLNDSGIRQTIIEEPLTNGELLKANALNAKFGALKKELDSIKVEVQGMNQVNSIGGVFACTSGVCFATVNGVAVGQTVARDYLAFINAGNVSIMSRLTTTTATAGQMQYWDGNVYSTDEQKRVKANEVEFLKCLDGVCFAKVAGFAIGQPQAKSYLAFVNAGNVSIMSRLTTTSTTAGQMQYWDGLNTYLTDESKRIKSNEVTILECTRGVCFASVNGVAIGQTIAKNYLAFLNAGNVSIMSRLTTTTATAGQMQYWDGNTYITDEQKRVLPEDVSFSKCITGVCFATVNGIAVGQTIAKNYFSFLNAGNVNIMSRITTTTTTAGQMQYWDGNTYITDEQKRVKSSEMVIP